MSAKLLLSAEELRTLATKRVEAKSVSPGLNSMARFHHRRLLFYPLRNIADVFGLVCRLQEISHTPTGKVDW